MINMRREVYINDTLVWGYERGGLYVLCSHLRVATSGKVRSGMDHAYWTTGGEVRRVGLRVGRFVELNHERAGLWKHMESLRPMMCVYWSCIGQINEIESFTW